MTKQELKAFFLNQLENGEFIFKVCKGNASYKMNRGSFKTKDVKFDFHTLTFKEKTDKTYIFTDGKVHGTVEVDDTEELKLNFKVDKEYNRISLTFKTFENEHIYGCGEQYTALDLKGKVVQIWVSEHQQEMKIARKLIKWKLFGPMPDKVNSYRSHQTYVSYPIFTSSMNYGFSCDCDSYGKISFLKNKTVVHFRDILSSISIITSDSMLELMGKICKTVGISPKVPDWVNDGAILAIQGGTDVLLSKYKEAKENGVKIAGIWSQDWCGNVVTKFGYQVFWNWTADENLYHDLPDVISQLNKEGVKFLGYINTFLKENAPLYSEAKEKGYLVMKDDGNVYHIKSTTFDAGIVDLTNPDAYEWYKDIIKENMISYGLSGFMADFGEYLPTDSVVHGGDAAALHNKWPTLWAKCCRDAIEESGKQDEIFVFSRAAFGDTIKYTNSVWNGDQHVDYSDEYGLGSVIPASLSLSCSGCGVTHSDIGGYTTVMSMRRDSELLNRWSEMNIFSPIFRTHEGNRPKDNVQFNDENVISEFAKNSNIYYDLKPYRLQTENEYQTSGIPMIRPLFAHFDDERSKTEKREYMFGSDILVSPVMRAKEEKHKVFLPEGKWVQFFTEEEYNGGVYELSSPLGLPMAFYKSDSSYKELFNDISYKYKRRENI